jgi:hypothetical protein
MGICKSNYYTDNIVVLVSRPIVCYGFMEQPKCPYLKECAEERIKPGIPTRAWNNFVKKHL